MLLFRKKHQRFLSNCSSLSSFTISSNNPFYKTIDGIVYIFDQSKLILCPANLNIDTLAISSKVIHFEHYSFTTNRNI